MKHKFQFHPGGEGEETSGAQADTQAEGTEATSDASEEKTEEGSEETAGEEDQD